MTKEVEERIDNVVKTVEHQGQEVLAKCKAMENMASVTHDDLVLLKEAVGAGKLGNGVRSIVDTEQQIESFATGLAQVQTMISDVKEQANNTEKQLRERMRKVTEESEAFKT